MDLELILIILLPLMALWIMILDRKVGKLKGNALDTEDLDHHAPTPGVDHEAIARQLYDWLIKRGNRKAISTHHVLDKAFGRPQIVYREDGVGYDMVYRDFSLVDYDLYLIDERLTELTEREGKYEMDFSDSIKNCDAQTYDIPFVFRKKRISKQNL
ncbi:MAG: hypothetical protein J6S99_04320 [Bacteroidales bacterium]|nr:hypothetical protein [Bacteroidales bacterium]